MKVKRGKYALVRLSELIRVRGEESPEVMAVGQLASQGVVEFDSDDNGFFVIKLRDRYAPKALEAYADAAEGDDPEYAAEVRALAARAGPNHPRGGKRPD